MLGKGMTVDQLYYLYAVLYEPWNVLYIIVDGTILWHHVHDFPSCHFPNFQSSKFGSISHLTNQRPLSIRPLSFLGDRPILRAFPGQLVHFADPVILVSVIFLFFDLLESVFFFFLNHHSANPTTYHHRTDPPVESLAFAPPCIYNNWTTLRAWSTYTTSRRPRCGLQQGCSMPQCSHLLAWAMPTFLILHWTQPSVL